MKEQTVVSGGVGDKPKTKTMSENKLRKKIGARPRPAAKKAAVPDFAKQAAELGRQLHLAQAELCGLRREASGLRQDLVSVWQKLRESDVTVVALRKELVRSNLRQHVPLQATEAEEPF